MLNYLCQHNCVKGAAQFAFRSTCRCVSADRHYLCPLKGFQRSDVVGKTVNGYDRSYLWVASYPASHVSESASNFQDSSPASICNPLNALPVGIEYFRGYFPAEFSQSGNDFRRMSKILLVHIKHRQLVVERSPPIVFRFSLAGGVGRFTHRRPPIPGAGAVFHPKKGPAAFQCRKSRRFPRQAVQSSVPTARLRLWR